MKKHLLTLAILLLTSTMYAQSGITKFKLNHTGFIGTDSTKNFNVLEFAGKKKNDLYKASLVYVSSIYNDPKKVITTIDGESIIINALTESIRDKSGLFKYKLRYNINLQFKDGKIRIEPLITDLTESFYSRTSKIYIADTDSPERAEVNCIWMTNGKNGGYFVFKNDIKTSIEWWINSYVSELSGSINKSDW